MADSKNSFLDDDDSEDLFVSAIESQSKAVTSNDSTLKSLTPTMDDVLNEIDLKDDDEDDGKDDSLDDNNKRNGALKSDKSDERRKKISTDDNNSSTITKQDIDLNGKEFHSPLTNSRFNDNNIDISNSTAAIIEQQLIEKKTIDDNSSSSSKATLPTSSTTTLSENKAGKQQEDNTATSEQVPTLTGVTSEMIDEHFIEIKIDSPQKVGEGMSSYVVYKLSTRTNLPFFRQTSFEVNRRFSDFLGLRMKLIEKHLHLGRIIPPAPEKEAISNVKVKLSKEETSNSPGSSDFIEKRRASLERFINRIAVHPILRTDPDFREFLQLATELPRATNTSTLSGASMRKLFNRVGDTVNKMTFHMDESDTWFEEKQAQIESLDAQLKKLHTSVESLIHHRKELTSCTGLFAKSAAMLGNCEEHTSLSCALSHLAELEEKIEQLHGEQANNDYLYLFDLLKDYIALIGSVKDVFHQRVKVFQTWQHAQQMLIKKREQKAKFELAGKADKIQMANEEVIEWESKVNRGREEFENISKTIKIEVEKFELNRIKDFKTNIIKYMETLLETQQKLIKYWEMFLPEAKAIA